MLQPLKRMWVFLTRNTSRGVAGVLLTMVATGIVSSAVFIFLDTMTNAWNGLSFIPNLVTSLVGFLVGVPIAYYVISEVLNRRDESREKAAVARLTARGWNDLRASVDTTLSAEIRDAVSVHVKSLYDGVGRIITELNTLHASSGSDESNFSWTKVVDARDLIARGLNEFNSRGAFYDKFYPAWNVTRSRWKFVENTIKVARFEHDMGWLDYETEEALVNSADLNPSPIEGLFSFLSPSGLGVGQTEEPFGTFRLMILLDQACQSRAVKDIYQDGYFKLTRFYIQLTDLLRPAESFIADLDKAVAKSADQAFTS